MLINRLFLLWLMGSGLAPQTLAEVDATNVVLKPSRTETVVFNPERVLFVGNSYFYYNDSLHNHVRRILAELKPELPTRYKSATIGGARLAHHDLDNLLTPGKLGIDEPFQLVILQGGSSETLTSSARSRFHTDADRLVGKIRKTGAEPALYMTHASVKPHPKVDAAMFEHIYRAYVAAGNRLDALVIPVGYAFELAYRERPDIALHEFFDGTHPSVLGTYLAACVVISSVYGLSAEGAEYDAYGAIESADAQFLQSLAGRAVKDFYAQ